jgi:hypothetical protein
MRPRELYTFCVASKDGAARVVSPTDSGAHRLANQKQGDEA